MAKSFFSGRAASFAGPANALEAVTPDDDADLSGGPTRALYVGGAGEIAVIDAAGNTVALRSGETQYHPISVRRVLQTGTTATGIVALY